MFGKLKATYDIEKEELYCFKKTIITAIINHHLKQLTLRYLDFLSIVFLFVSDATAVIVVKLLVARISQQVESLKSASYSAIQISRDRYRSAEVHLLFTYIHNT